MKQNAEELEHANREAAEKIDSLTQLLEEEKAANAALAQVRCVCHALLNCSAMISGMHYSVFEVKFGRGRSQRFCCGRTTCKLQSSRPCNMCLSLESVPQQIETFQLYQAIHVSKTSTCACPVALRLAADAQSVCNGMQNEDSLKKDLERSCKEAVQRESKLKQCLQDAQGANKALVQVTFALQNCSHYQSFSPAWQSNLPRKALSKHCYLAQT